MTNVHVCEVAWSPEREDEWVLDADELSSDEKQVHTACPLVSSERREQRERETERETETERERADR